MNSTQLNLETVTPMFLRGSDNETLDLRPPAFKALFRYWWRAAVGETDVDTLRRTEGDLFGSMKGRSPLSIRIPGSASPPSGEYAPLPHDPDRFRSQAYKPNENFNLTLTAPVLTEYERIATLSFLLGGVGNRSRRGFGSIRYQNWNFQDVNGLQNEVYQALEGISPGRFHVTPHGIEVASAVHLPDYPVIRAIYFGNTLSNDAEALLLRIGQATHNHSHNALGSAGPRMASPIHVRIQKVGNQFASIVTQLNSVFPDAPPHGYNRRQQDFIDEIIA